MTAALLLWVLGMASPAFAAPEGSVSPYLDEIREDLRKQDAEEGAKNRSSEGYTEKLQKKLRQEDEERAKELGDPAPGSQTYIDQLIEEDPTLKDKDTSGGYTDRVRPGLPRKEQGGAIQAVLEGRSELKPRKEGEISGAFGFRMGASLTRDIQGGEREARPFDDVYGAGWAPEVQFLYEYQPWRSETWGSFGFIGSFGLSFFNGFGRFRHQLVNDATGEPFPIESQTRFNFFQVPVMVGGVIRLNTLKFVRPFVMAGPMGISFFESRNDDKSGSRGFSKALYVSAGISIPLDWLSSTSSWDLYKSFGIHQYYLTIDYSKVTTIASEVNFDVSGASAGLTFEF